MTQAERTELACDTNDKAGRRDGAASVVGAGAMTRRNVMNMLTGTAAAVAASAVAGLSVPSPARAESASPHLLKLAAELAEAQARHEVAMSALDTADRAMFEWTSRNPKPKMRECWVGSSREGDDYIRRSLAGEDPGPDPNADLKAAIAEHSAAIKSWSAKRAAANRACGATDAKQQEDAASEKVCDVADRIETAPCAGLADLRLKARLAAELEIDSMAWAVINDVLNLAEPPAAEADTAAAKVVLQPIRELIEEFRAARRAWEAVDVIDETTSGKTPEWDTFTAAEQALIAYRCHNSEEIAVKVTFALGDDGFYDAVRNCRAVLPTFLRSLIV